MSREVSQEPQSATRATAYSAGSSTRRATLIAAAAAIVAPSLVAGLVTGGILGLSAWLSDGQLLSGLDRLVGTRAALALDDESKDDGEKENVKFILHGPNDGEPINGRILRLRACTDYTGDGEIAVQLNGKPLYRRPLRQNGHWEHGSDFVTDIDIDLVLAEIVVRDELLGPDAGPARVLVQLYSSEKPQKFVTSYYWSGYVGKPWFEIVPAQAPAAPPPGGPDAEAPHPGEGAPSPEQNLNGDVPAKLTTQVVIYAQGKDLIYLLVASPQREVLALSPDNPRLLREGKLLSTGSLPPARRGEARRCVVGLDSNGGANVALFAVVWTLDSEGAWKRSVIAPLPSTR